MDDYRLIQNKSGEIYRFTGDEPPPGWRWYTEPVRRVVHISGTYSKMKQAAPVVEETETGALKMRTTIYSRIVGYYAPVNLTWNRGKVQEFKERQTYSVEKALAHAENI